MSDPLPYSARACINCRYFALRNGAQTYGECRRKSPEIQGASGNGKWPIVVQDDWCGDIAYKSR